MRPTSRRWLLLVLPPLLLALLAAAAASYFVWWDATHCVFCRSRLDAFGRCPNPQCGLGRLTSESEPAPLP
jgi:hypothetical protein